MKNKKVRFFNFILLRQNVTLVSSSYRVKLYFSIWNTPYSTLNVSYKTKLYSTYNITVLYMRQLDIRMNRKFKYLY